MKRIDETNENCIETRNDSPESLFMRFLHYNFSSVVSILLQPIIYTHNLVVPNLRVIFLITRVS